MPLLARKSIEKTLIQAAEDALLLVQEDRAKLIYSLLAAAARSCPVGPDGKSLCVECLCHTQKWDEPDQHQAECPVRKDLELCRRIVMPCSIP